METKFLSGMERFEQGGSILFLPDASIGLTSLHATFGIDPSRSVAVTEGEVESELFL